MFSSGGSSREEFACSTREEFAFKLIEVVGRIDLLAAGGLRSLVSYWLLMEDHLPL